MVHKTRGCASCLEGGSGVTPSEDQTLVFFVLEKIAEVQMEIILDGRIYID